MMTIRRCDHAPTCRLSACQGTTDPWFLLLNAGYAEAALGSSGELCSCQPCFAMIGLLEEKQRSVRGD